MLLTMALLAYLAYRYTYVKIQSKEDIDENENIDNNNDNNIPLEEKPSKSDKQEWSTNMIRLWNVQELS